MKKILCTIAMIGLSFNIQAGGKGNGGDSVVCFKKDFFSLRKLHEVRADLERVKKIELMGGEGITSIFSRKDIIAAIDSVELLDLYENGITPNGQKVLWREIKYNSNPKENVIEIFNLLNKKIDLGSQLIKQFLKLNFKGTSLSRNVDDADFTGGIDDNCVLIQGAIRYGHKVEINHHLFDLMDITNQTALYVHETVYKNYDYEGASSRIRPFVANLITKNYLGDFNVLDIFNTLGDLIISSTYNFFPDKKGKYKNSGSGRLNVSILPRSKIVLPLNKGGFKISLSAIEGYPPSSIIYSDYGFEKEGDFKLGIEKCLDYNEIDFILNCQYTFDDDSSLIFQGKSIKLLTYDGFITFFDSKYWQIRSFYNSGHSGISLLTAPGVKYQFLRGSIIANKNNFVQEGEVEIDTPKSFSKWRGRAKFSTIDGSVSSIVVTGIKGKGYSIQRSRLNPIFSIKAHEMKEPEFILSDNITLRNSENESLELKSRFYHEINTGFNTRNGELTHTSGFATSFTTKNGSTYSDIFSNISVWAKSADIRKLGTWLTIKKERSKLYVIPFRLNILGRV